MKSSDCRTQNSFGIAQPPKLGRRDCDAMTLAVKVVALQDSRWCEKERDVHSRINSRQTSGKKEG